MKTEHYLEILPLLNEATLWHLKIRQLTSRLATDEKIDPYLESCFEKAKDDLVMKLIEQTIPSIQELIDHKILIINE